MELLFNNERKHQIALSAQSQKNPNDPATLQDLIFYIRDNMMTEKKDLFVDKDTV
jgi:ubiquitin related modifier 1